MFETCVEVYNLLILLYQHKRDYTKQSTCYKEMFRLCKLVTDDRTRLFYNYYRVSFFIPEGLFPEDGIIEYIYRVPGKFKLAEFTDKLYSRFASKVSKERIVVLPTTTELESENKNPNSLYLQIIQATPYLDNEERRTEYERNFNCTKFRYEVPFTRDGGIHTDDITQQWKRINITEISQAFPHIFNRLTVVSKSINELTPIQNAIESISSTVHQLQNEISISIDSKSQLQLLLQGILLAQFVSGPVVFAKIFLSEEEKYPKEDIDTLKTTFIELIKLIAKAVHKNKGLIENNQLIIQNQLEISYFKMKDEVIQLTHVGPEEIIEDFVLPPDMLGEPPIIEEESNSQTQPDNQKEKKKKGFFFG